MKTYFETDRGKLYQGHVLNVLKEMSPESVQCVVTSPPYWGLRDYGIKPQVWDDKSNGRDLWLCEHVWGEIQPEHHPGQVQDNKAVTDESAKGQTLGSGQFCQKCGAWKGSLGLEPTPELFISHIVQVFREVKRVLHKSGTVWLNLGDSYAGNGPISQEQTDADIKTAKVGNAKKKIQRRIGTVTGLKPKDLCGIPWAVAKALQQPYYKGDIKKERDRVWLAAMIDGEGTICGYTHERKDGTGIRTGIHINMTNSNMALLDEAFRIWPTSKEQHNAHGKGHYGSLPTKRWVTHNIDKKSQLLAELFPYLIAKKIQAILAWNFIEISKKAKRQQPGPRETKEDKEKRAWIVESLSKLNHQKPVDIPSWIKYPPSLYEPGWYLRSDIIWSKPNPMPESVTDRPTKSHEYLFLLTKNSRYFYDAEAIREKGAGNKWGKYSNPKYGEGSQGKMQSVKEMTKDEYIEKYQYRNKHTVWTIPTQPFPESHFAVFPEKLVEPCIKAGTSEKGCCPECGEPWVRDIEYKANYEKREVTHTPNNTPTKVDSTGWNPPSIKQLGWKPGCKCSLSYPSKEKPEKTPFNVIPCTILDPFFGSGTVAVVAERLRQNWIGIELSKDYCELAENRVKESIKQMKLF